MPVDLIGISLLLGGFLFLMLLRVPIAFALGLASLATVFYLQLPPLMVAQRMVNGLNSFTFLAVPFFILVGNLMTEGGISDKLVRLADVLVGRMRGGLAQGNVVASTLFGGISGSSVADVASIGSFLIPAMVRSRYPAGYSVAVTVTSSVQGVMIPPSQNMIFYALAAGGLPISTLFLAGYVPGLLLGLSLMIIVYIMARRHNHPMGGRYGLRESLRILADATIGLFTIVIIIGGILTGVFTATESAGVAVVYALLVTLFWYRSLTWKAVGRIFSTTLTTLAMVTAIIMTSSVFGFLLSYLRVPAVLADAMFSISREPIFVLMAVNIFLLIMGMLMDMGILILLLTPILLPIVTQVGVDPIHFGIIMVLNLGIGLCTPPVGTSLLVGAGVARIPLEEATKSLWPFYFAMVIVLLLVTYIPALSLTLPALVR